MGVELDLFGTGAIVGIEDLTRHFDSFKNGGGSAGAGSIFESNAVKRNSGSEDLIQTVNVKLRSVGIGFSKVRSQSHQSNRDLMFQTVFGNGTTGNIEVAHVIERIEVTDSGNAVFLEKFGMQVDDVAGLAGKTDHVHAAGKSLQIDIRSDGFPPFIHHFKSIFLAVKIERLETGSAADFNVVDTGFHRGIKRGEEIFCFDPGTETGLESVTERAIHEFDFFHLYT